MAGQACRPAHGHEQEAIANRPGEKGPKAALARFGQFLPQDIEDDAAGQDGKKNPEQALIDGQERAHSRTEQDGPG